MATVFAGLSQNKTEEPLVKKTEEVCHLKELKYKDFSFKNAFVNYEK